MSWNENLNFETILKCLSFHYYDWLQSWYMNQDRGADTAKKK